MARPFYCLMGMRLHPICSGCVSDILRYQVIYTVQGRRSLRGRGATAPLFLVDFINFTLKNAVFKINFMILPPFSELKVSPSLFFEASYGPVGYKERRPKTWGTV